MTDTYQVDIVKTATVEVSLEEAHAWIVKNDPGAADLPDALQVETYMSWAEGREIEPDFGREIFVNPIAEDQNEPPDPGSICPGENAMIEALVARGFAIVILTPEELRGVDPGVIEDRMCEVGMEAVGMLTKGGVL
jgi:hypothetical protein